MASLFCHPCGSLPVEWLLSVGNPPAGGRILDFGCGDGSTAALLRQKGFDAHGFDLALREDAPAFCTRADVRALAEPAACADAVLFECSLSRIEPPERALSQARRALKDDGALLLCDVYARRESARFQGALGRLDRRETLLALLEESGFAVQDERDYTRQLQDQWLQTLWDCDTGVCLEDVDLQTLRRARCGYLALFAKKRREKA